LVLNKTSVSLVLLLQDVIENIQLKYPQSNIKIEANSPDITVEADVFHLTNICYNLLDNAIKYCEKTPEITIKINNEFHQIKVAFIDNGIGISNKNLPFIFDKFYRIPSVKSNEVNGFGLGLHYVKKICTLHHWKISAQSHSNGTTITLFIPDFHGKM
jgi:two-component system phosphate regulon sensor histidine kinase PhoR